MFVCFCFLRYSFCNCHLYYSVYTFHNVYTKELQREMDDAWLRGQCRNADFYMKMRQHTDVCAQVEANYRQSKILKAATVVVSGTYLCGSNSCVSLVDDVTSSRGFVWICLLCCAALYALAWIVQGRIFWQKQALYNKHFCGMPVRTWVDEHLTESEYLNGYHQSKFVNDSARLRHKQIDVINDCYQSDILYLT